LIAIAVEVTNEIEKFEHTVENKLINQSFSLKISVILALKI
jgi:hypothetical protein